MNPEQLTNSSDRTGRIQKVCLIRGEYNFEVNNIIPDPLLDNSEPRYCNLRHCYFLDMNLHVNFIMQSNTPTLL